MKNFTENLIKMKKTPINAITVKAKIMDSGLAKIGRCSIREMVKIVNEIEQETGEQFVRMELGIPGLKPSKIAINAEIAALNRGVASTYPMIEGIPEFKSEAARFVKLFIDLDVLPANCIPTVGTLQGSMAVFLVANRANPEKDEILFIDPGFPVQKKQCQVLKQKHLSFDVYEFRGTKLRDKLESYLKSGRISSIVYSNPNNPTWICFTEKELQIIGELANKYDTIVIEDLAYLCMDFRKDLSKPGLPPFQPSIGKFTKNYILLISSSKIFSYAGQRIGLLVISDYLSKRRYPALIPYYNSEEFCYSVVYGALYALTAGTSHSTKYAFTALLKAASEGKYNFVDVVKEYSNRAKEMKKIFLDNGFKLVYDKDEDQPIGDGFYFTLSYPGFSGEDLVEELLYYGISAISLNITGSSKTEGIRACVSFVDKSQYGLLKSRLKQFHQNHS